MGNRRISEDIKECALRLSECGWDVSDICFALGISQASIYRWKRVFETFGQVTKPPSGIRGRPRIIGIAAFKLAEEIFARNNDTYLDEVQWCLAVELDIVVSIPAIHNALQRAGLTRKLLGR
ncbi:hypothetical protein D9758_015447 [Tetrapyrgos nigripes]|uniref:Transposase n=1 Tax=Tetrapyrgos nigripes TaxID=182062 RepID=A0A8H5FNF5_9AGAR|nr:hypothetical protein D9758_015447 [Tetrapyrgos nigripes]